MPELNLRTISLAVLGALAGALITAAVVLLARGGGNAPIQVLLPTPGQTSSQTDSEGGRKTLAPEDDAPIKVDIRGAVRTPGVYTLPPGSRLDDAVEAAGGVTDGADMEAMHLSIRVQDEGYYYIGRIGETPRPPIATASASTQIDNAGDSGSSSGGVIDLNAASVTLLETLPGIGEVRASAIVDYRRQNGCFQSTLEVTEVPGIGSGTYEKIRDLVTVGLCP